jgi:rhodanese-related sulfurtransferase
MVPRKVTWVGVLLILTALVATGSLAWSADTQQPYQVMTTAELQAVMKSKPYKFLLIDARNPEEYQDVHIPGAINVPEKKFDEHVRQLPEDKDIRLIFYCNGVKCGKSKRAAQKATTLGYRHLFVYEEGMPVWEEAGLPIVPGPHYEAKMETTRISPQELNKLITSKRTDFLIVDVRDQSEFAEGHIPGAINIPVALFASRAGELDKTKTIIVYCNAGNRSYQAYRKLMKLAYDKYYQALFADWKAAGFAVEK